MRFVPHAESIERQRMQSPEEAGECRRQLLSPGVAHAGEIQQRRAGQFRVRRDNARGKGHNACGRNGQRQPPGKSRKDLRFPQEITTRAVMPWNPNDQLPGVEHMIVLPGVDDFRRQDFQPPEDRYYFIYARTHRPPSQSNSVLKGSAKRHHSALVSKLQCGGCGHAF